jgi:DNA-binding transcriptional ArsR family regulator
MPRLTSTEARPKSETVEFVFSVPLDLMNAMYFTHLVAVSEGVEGWPVRVREEMASDLLAELDSLYSFPKGQPGIMGQLGDVLFAHPEAWDSVDSLLDFVRNLPLGLGESETEAGIQGLAFYICCSMHADCRVDPGSDPREQIRREVEKEGGDAKMALALFDEPAALRDRMVRLIERFYREHYQAELSNRRQVLERSVAAHRGSTKQQAIEDLRALSGRPTVCLEDVCPGPYDSLVFAPSLDMGPYMSCADLSGPRMVHGLFYPCEARFMGNGEAEAEETTRMARIYKALSDEQRLRILHMLRDNEMYAQEIVDRIGLHQSVVSRHLSFLRAVGLVQIRKHNTMKYYSLNPDITRQLEKTIGLFVGSERKGGLK